MAYDQDILALVESVPYEQRKDPTTARKIAEMIAMRASAKMDRSIAYQDQAAEQNERMFSPQQDVQAELQAEQMKQQPPQQPGLAAPEEEGMPEGPDMGELL